MSQVAYRTDADWISAALTDDAHPDKGSLVLAPTDLSPSRNWAEVDQDGNAVGWVLEQGVIRLAQHHYVSRAGNRPAGAGVPAIEEDPPRRDTLVRQTPVGLTPGEAWAAFQALIYGYTPQWVEESSSDLPRPLAPELEVVATSKKGFPDDRYGLRIDLRPKGGGRSIASGFTYIEAADMATGNHFKVYVADYMGGAAVEIGFYVTRPGSGGLPGTERLVQVSNLYRAQDNGYIEVHGPYRDNGKRPSTTDQSGLGRPPEPLIGRRHPGRFSVIKLPARFNLQAGRYHFGIQIFNGRGWCPAGQFTREVVVEGDEVDRVTKRRLNANEDPEGGETLQVINGVRYAVTTTTITLPYEEGRAYWFIPPRLPEGWRWRPWVQYEPLNAGGGLTFMSGYHGPKNTRGIEGSYSDFRGDDGTLDRDERWAVPFYGYAAEAEPSGLNERFAVNTPVFDVDESGIEQPDPSTGPQVEATGPDLPDVPATYLAGVADEDNLGHETVISPTRRVVLNTSETFRIKPVLRTNMIRNAEGSERTSDGAISDWRGIGTVGTTTSSFTDGTLGLIGLGSSNPTTGTPLPRTDPVSVSDDQSVTFMATMYAQAPSSGSFLGGSQWIVEHLSEANLTTLAATPTAAITPLDTTVLLALTSADQDKLVTLKPDGYTIGPTGSDQWAAGTAGYRLVLRPTPGGGNWNENLFVRDVAAVDGTVMLRKFESLGSGKPVTFAPNPGVAYPTSSVHAVGPTPEAEATPSASAAPESTNTFENNAFTGWTLRTPPGSNVAATVAIEAAAAQVATRGIRIENQTTSNVAEAIYTRNMGSNIPARHLRWLDECVQLPTKGLLHRAWILDQNGDGMARISYSSGGQMRMYRYKNDGSINPNYTVVLTGLQDGQKLDAEVGVAGGNSKSGLVRALAGIGGNARTELAKVTGLDFTGRYPRIMWWGALESESAAKWEIHGDDVIVTSTGYSTQTVTAAPLTPIVPDAPPISSTYRLYEYPAGVPSGAIARPLNQWWWFNELGVELGGERGGPRTIRPISVVPGYQYTQAVQMAWEFTSTSDQAVHQFGVLLTGAGKTPLFIGSPFGPGPDATAVGRVGGTRSSSTAMAATGAWAAEDYWHSFTVPPLEDEYDSGYTQAWILPVNAQQGVHVAQEHLFGRDNLDTQTLRDQARAYGRGTTGSATLIFDTYTPEGAQAHNMPLRQEILSQGLVSSDPGDNAGVYIDNVSWQAADTVPDLATATAVSNPALLPDSRYRQLSFSLHGDGAEGAEVGPGGAYVNVKPYISTLLREDRSEFTGGTFVDGVEAIPERRRYQVQEVAGEYIASARSRPVRFAIKPITIHTFSEEGMLEIMATRPTDRLAIEAPFIGGSGTIWIIVSGQEITFDTDPNSALIREAEQRLKRYVHGVAQVTAFKVIEEAAMV